LALILLAGLVGCGGNQDFSDHELVGVWAWDGNPFWQYDFRGDGTGTRGMPDDGQEFTWSIRGSGHIRMVVNHRREDWNYIINDYNLTLDNRVFNETYTYRRLDATAEINSALVGVWNGDDNMLWQHTFNADGTGVTGFPDDLEDIMWTIPEPGWLRIDGPGWRDDWNYTVDGDSLTLVSRQVVDLTFTYIRDGAERPINPKLVGVWNWDDNALWQYTFNADGTGTMGLPDSLEIITWFTPEPGRLSVNSLGWREEWNYTLDGDSLILDSRQQADVTYTHTRES